MQIDIRGRGFLNRRAWNLNGGGPFFETKEDPIYGMIMFWKWSPIDKWQEYVFELNMWVHFRGIRICILKVIVCTRSLLDLHKSIKLSQYLIIFILNNRKIIIIIALMKPKNWLLWLQVTIISLNTHPNTL